MPAGIFRYPRQKALNRNPNYLLKVQGCSVWPQMTVKHPKRPRDPAQLAKMMIDIATGQRMDSIDTSSQKNEAAVARGRLGGLKGGKARAENLTAAQKKVIAKRAARARWEKKK